MVEEWEQRRACVNPPPGVTVRAEWFDVDANRYERDLAKGVCDVCPVWDKCNEEVIAKVLSRGRVVGFYAGKEWSASFKGHRPTKERRLCEFLPCKETFLVGVHSRKKFCSEKCRQKVRWNPELGRTAERQAAEA